MAAPRRTAARGRIQHRRRPPSSCWSAITPAGAFRGRSTISACPRPNSSGTSPGTSASPAWPRRCRDALDAHLIVQIYSRLVIDCNRAAGRRRPRSRRSANAPRFPAMKVCRARPTAARVREIFVPYHARIADMLDAREARRPARRCWSRCTASRRSMPALRGRGRSACSTTATACCPPLR